MMPSCRLTCARASATPRRLWSRLRLESVAVCERCGRAQSSGQVRFWDATRARAPRGHERGGPRAWKSVQSTYNVLSSTSRLQEMQMIVRAKLSFLQWPQCQSRLPLMSRALIGFEDLGSGMRLVPPNIFRRSSARSRYAPLLEAPPRPDPAALALKAASLRGRTAGHPAQSCYAEAAQRARAVRARAKGLHSHRSDRRSTAQ